VKLDSLIYGDRKMTERITEETKFCVVSGVPSEVEKTIRIWELQGYKIQKLRQSSIVQPTGRLEVTLTLWRVKKCAQ
jgi:hypothetical protein